MQHQLAEPPPFRAEGSFGLAGCRRLREGAAAGAGLIAPGAAGDFVVTDSDPLDDIGVLAETRLGAVIQDGVIVKEY